MKKMKKLFALLLTMAMTLAMAVCVSATASSTLTISGAKSGHTYKVYQLLTGDVKDGTLSNAKKGSNLNTDNVTDFIDAITADGLSENAISKLAYTYVQGDPVATLSTSKTSETLTNGYYIVTDEWTSDADGTTAKKSNTLSLYMVKVVGATTISTKDTTVSDDKKIIDEDSNEAISGSDSKVDTAAIGDVIEYEVTTNVPDTSKFDYFYFSMNDTLSEGLTLNADSFVVTIGSTTLTKHTSGAVASNEYYVESPEAESDGTNSFKVTFSDIAALVKAGTVNVGDPISIKYTATVNDNAKIGDEANTNTEHFVFSNNPNKNTGSKPSEDTPDEPSYPTEPQTPSGGSPDDVKGVTPDKTTYTYITQLTINKIDTDGNALTGAEFTLTGDNLTKVKVTVNTAYTEDADGTYYKLTDGTYTTTNPSGVSDATALAKYVKNDDDTYTAYKATTTADVEDATTTTPHSVTATVGADGKLTFTGLNAGNYTLNETDTPAGYNTMAEKTFNVKATLNSDKTSVTFANTGDLVTGDATNNVFEADIENTKGLVLPSTGGMGTALFYLIGGILVVGAGVLLVSKKRMAK